MDSDIENDEMEIEAKKAIVQCCEEGNRLDQVVLQAELMSPRLAVETGFLDEVVEPDALLPRVNAIAATLAAYPGTGYAGNKQLLRNRFASRIIASL